MKIFKDFIFKDKAYTLVKDEALNNHFNNAFNKNKNENNKKCIKYCYC